MVWESKFLGVPLKERVAGIDLMENLVEMAHQKSIKYFFMGAKEEIVSKLASIYVNQYSPEILVGYRNGYFTEEQEGDIVKDIANSGAHMLSLLSHHQKKKTFFININQHFPG